MKAWIFQSLPAGVYSPVIAVDPGKATGVAELRVDGSVFACEGDWDETLDYVDQALATYLASGLTGRLVSESFTITAKTASNTQAPWSLEANGALKRAARRNGWTFETQLPVEAKNFATMARLKAMGWWKSTPGGHVNDALRHLYLKLATQGLVLPPPGVV